MLRASAEKVDLAPSAGSWMTGFASRTRPATGTHDPIFARALVLDDGNTRLAIVSCDLLGLSPDTASRMRRNIAAQSPIPAENILICCTHTHSGPACVPMRGPMGRVDDAWLAKTQEKIVSLVARTSAELRPARLAYGNTNIRNIGFNRQDKSKGVDEELTAVGIDSPDGSAIATIVNYATHAVVLGPENLLFSSDFPGQVSQQIEQTRGGTALYLQGACGDVDPAIYRDRGWGRGTFEDAVQIGVRLADETLTVLRDACGTEQLTLQAATQIIDVPLEAPPTAETLAKLKTEFENELQKTGTNPTDPADEQMTRAMLEWADQLQRAVQAATVPKSIQVEVFAAGINGLRLIGVPFEAYSDIAKAIKSRLRPLTTIFAGYANGLYGYCPSRWAKQQGGYGPELACRWFAALPVPLAEGADDILIDRTLELVMKLPC